MKMYLAGPMTGVPGLNLPAAAQAAKLLRAQGHEIVSPWEEEGIPENANYDVTDEEYDAFLEDDMRLIDQVEALVLLPGWNKSGGTGREIRHANKLGLRVYLYKGDHRGARIIGPVGPWLTEGFGTTERATA